MGVTLKGRPVLSWSIHPLQRSEGQPGFVGWASFSSQPPPDIRRILPSAVSGEEQKIAVAVVCFIGGGFLLLFLTWELLSSL